jgi:beta-N-acetylhexosaminidase
MRLRIAAICLALLATVPGMVSCSALGDSGTGSLQQDTTTLAPTTTTALSQAQVTLETMTVRQKAAQVLLLGFSGTSLSAETSALLAAGPPGGLLVHASNFTDASQLRVLTAALQQAAAATGSPVGLLIAVDQEGGKVQRVTGGVPTLPSARKLGTESTPDEASELARQTARGLLDLGVNMNLAPVADVVADKTSFLYDRSYGSDPALVSEYVTAIIQASQGQGLICVVKHFPGHGSAPGDTHEAAAVSHDTAEQFDTIHLPPFRAAISAGVEGVMVAHIVATAYDADKPASVSQSILTELLRDDLGFQGLVVADDLAMPAVLQSVALPTAQAATATTGAKEAKTATEARAAVAALNAGCDLLILSEAETNSTAVLADLVAAIEQGKVSEARLDEAVLKILDLKYRYGLTPPPLPGVTSTTATQGTTTP